MPFGKIPMRPVMKAPVIRAPFFPAEYQCSEPEINCPDGFILQGKACEKPIISVAENICNVGKLAGDQCITKMPAMKVCNDGFVLQGGSCVTSISAPMLQFCPEGFLEGGKGKCSKNVPVPIVEFCEQGVQDSGACLIIKSQAPLVNTFCPPGFDNEAGECCKIETYDCTPPGAEPLSCEDGDDSPGCFGKGRLLHGKAFVPPKPVEVTKEIAVVQQTCQKRIVTEMLKNVSCAMGELIGSQCIIKEFIPLSQRCPALGDTANCFTTQFANFLFDCPSGFNMQGAQCVAPKVEPFMLNCPNGFNLMDSLCMKPLPAVPVCNEGMLGSDGMCHDKEFAPPITSWCTTCVGSNCVQTQCNGMKPRQFSKGM